MQKVVPEMLGRNDKDTMGGECRKQIEAEHELEEKKERLPGKSAGTSAEEGGGGSEWHPAA